MNDQIASDPQCDNPADESALEEIAQDMLHLLERVKTMERHQCELAVRVGQLAQAMDDFGLAQGRAIDALRRDLLGDRQALSARRAFDAIAPALDGVRAMRHGLGPGSDDRLLAQLGAVANALGGVIQGLGFREFIPAMGETFDPARMECMGFTAGEHGVVLAAVHAGYLANDTLIRPAGVLIADGDRAAPQLASELIPIATEEGMNHEQA